MRREFDTMSDHDEIGEYSSGKQYYYTKVSSDAMEA